MGKPFKGVVSIDEETGLLVAKAADLLSSEMRSQKARPGLLSRVPKSKTIYGPDGRPVAQVHVSDWGNTHHEFEDHVDAVARPATLRAFARGQ